MRISRSSQIGALNCCICQMSHSSLLLGFALLLSVASSASSGGACPDCDARQHTSVRAITEEFAADIHSKKGIRCDACHAGVDAEYGHGKAVAPKYSIQRERIPQLCGSCHADANRIKQFNPSLRTDQWALYRTSTHGIKLVHGDTRVAVCTDCHTTHSIRSASDPRSSVHPLNIATTCKRCHADADYMKPYRIATDQFADYTDSVHHKALVANGDLSAPTCSTCHGSHGAAPVGVESVANVCGTCHVFQAKYFDESPHKQAFARMDLPSCITCHTSHHIKHPDDSFLGTGPVAVCGNCHTKEELAGQTADGIHDKFHHLETDIADARSLLDRAQHGGMDVTASQLELAQANDALTKARVTLHTARLAPIETDLAGGTKITVKAHAAGVAALKERDKRRKTVLFPVFALVALVISLGAYLREIERDKKQ
jgi:hypothetical protein